MRNDNVGLKTSEKGSIFVMVAVISSVLMIMVVGLLNSTLVESRITNSYVDGIKAYYLAETGIQQAIAYSISNIGVNGTSTTNNIFSAVYNKDHSVTWSVVYVVADATYTATAQAIYGKTAKNMRAVYTITAGIVTLTELKQY